jgi:hypothetical protein
MSKSLFAITLIASASVLVRPAAAQEPTAGDEISDWHLRATLMPPLMRVMIRNGETPTPYTTRLGLGVRAPNGVWGEGSGGATLGINGLGWDASLVGGATLGRVAPDPGNWTLSAPVFLGYRYAKRAPSGATDAHTLYEDLHMVVVGGRGAFTRWAAGGNGLELGLELSLSVPFARTEPDSPYYGDGPTRTILEAGLYIAWLIDTSG